MRAHLRDGRIQPFGALLAPRVAGWHDGEKSAIDFDFVNSGAVFHHEQAHETIFLKTPDGILLSVLYRLLDARPRVDLRLMRRVEATANAMFEASRVAHEVAATYLGLKMLSPVEAGIAERLLPPDYQRYYRTAADVVDPHFGSTYLQVAVLSAIAHFAFGSTLLAEFVARNWPRYAKLKREHQPNWRLDSLLTRLAEGKVSELRTTLDQTADAFFTHTGHRRWDLDAEDGWTAVPVAGHLLDLALAEAVEHWLTAQQWMPVLQGEPLGAALARLEALAASVSLPITIHRVTTPAASDVQNPPDLTELVVQGESLAAARRQAASVIANPNTLSVPTLNGAAFLTHPDFTTAKSLVVLDADPYAPGAPWTVIASGLPTAKTNCLINGIPCLAAHLTHRDVVEWLNAIAYGDECGWQGVEPVLIVISLGGDARSVAERDHPGPLAPRWNERMACYLAGNWSTLMEAGARLGGVEATEIIVGIRPQDAMDDPAGEATIHLKIARGDAIPGKCAFRPFGRNASTAMTPLEAAWQARPEIRFLSTDDAESAGFDSDAVVTALGCIVAFWSFF